MFKKLVVVAAVLCACGVGPAFAAEQPRPLGAGIVAGVQDKLTEVGIEKVFIEFQGKKIEVSPTAFRLFGALMQLIDGLEEEDEALGRKNKSVTVEWRYSELNAASKYKVTVDDIRLLVRIAEGPIFDYSALSAHQLCIMFSLAHAAGAMSTHTDEEKKQRDRVTKFPRSLVVELASEIQRRLRTSNGAAYYELVWEVLQNISYGAQELLALKGAVLPVMRLPGEFEAMLGEDRIVVDERRENSWFTRIVDREGKQVLAFAGWFRAMLGEDRIVVGEWRDTRIVDREGKQVGGKLPGEFEAKLGEDRIVVVEWRDMNCSIRIMDREGKQVGVELPGKFKAKLGEDRIVVDNGFGVRIVDREGKQVGGELPGEFKAILSEDRIVVFCYWFSFFRIVDREGKQVGGELPGEFRAMLGEDRIVVGEWRGMNCPIRIMDREGKRVGGEFPGRFVAMLGEDRIVVGELRDNSWFTRIVDREGKSVGGELPGRSVAMLGEDRIVVDKGRGVRIVDREGKQVGVEFPGEFKVKLGEDRIVVGEWRDTRIVDREGKQVGVEFPGQFKAVLPNGLLAAGNALFCPVPLTFHQHVLFVVLFGVIEQQGGVRSLLRSFVTTPRTLSTVLSNVTFLDIFVSMPDEAIRILHRVHGKALEQIVIGNMIERLKKLFDKVDEFDSCRVDIARLVMLFGVAQDDPLRKQLKKLDEKRRPSFKGTKDSKKETPDYLD